MITIAQRGARGRGEGVVSYLFDGREAYRLHALHAVPIERERVPDRQPAQQLHEGLRADLRHAVEEQYLAVGPPRVVEGADVEHLRRLVLEERST